LISVFVSQLETKTNFAVLVIFVLLRNQDPAADLPCHPVSMARSEVPMTGISR